MKNATDESAGLSRSGRRFNHIGAARFLGGPAPLFSVESIGIGVF
jgi:hypothetical protein